MTLTIKRLAQLVVTHGDGFRLFGRFRALRTCDQLQPVATTGLHKGSIVCNQSRQRTRSRILGSTLSLC